MMDAIDVSVIIPVYNAEAYLKECLDAVLKLKGAAFEVILINDGSTDGSTDILRQFAGRESRAVLLEGPNRGASEARNLGLEKARGRYVCFVDADDIPYENMLSDLLSEAGKADVCIGKKTRWNQIKDYRRTDGWPPFRGDLRSFRKVLWHYKRSMRGATGRLYRLDVIRKNSLKFSPELNYGEDMRFNYDFCRVASELAFADKVVYLYRIHNKDSLSNLYAPHFMKQWKAERECIGRLFR